MLSRSYFESLLEDKPFPLSGQPSLWVGLSFRGRVFGSDFGVPIWDELLAAMPPTAQLASTEETFALAETCGALEAQRNFYETLNSGDVPSMIEIFDSQKQRGRRFRCIKKNTRKITAFFLNTILCHEAF